MKPSGKFIYEHPTTRAALLHLSSAKDEGEIFPIVREADIFPAGNFSRRDACILIKLHFISRMVRVSSQRACRASPDSQIWNLSEYRNADTALRD